MSRPLGFRFALAWALVAAAANADDFAKWRCYRALILDTSAAGANVGGDVANYPVAVALHAANFDFATTRPDGADLRFCADKNGPLLPHVVEHWDAAAKMALVWVKVPLVRGNTDAQLIIMQWQNPEASSVANPAEVFSTRDGSLACGISTTPAAPNRAATRTPRRMKPMARA